MCGLVSPYHCWIVRHSLQGHTVLLQFYIVALAKLWPPSQTHTEGNVDSLVKYCTGELHRQQTQRMRYSISKEDSKSCLFLFGGASGFLSARSVSGNVCLETGWDRCMILEVLVLGGITPIPRCCPQIVLCQHFISNKSKFIFWLWTHWLLAPSPSFVVCASWLLSKQYPQIYIFGQTTLSSFDLSALCLRHSTRFSKS